MGGGGGCHVATRDRCLARGALRAKSEASGTEAQEQVGRETASSGRREREHHKKQGHGTLTLPNGGKYEGQFYKDKKQGQGTLTPSNGGKYEGQWHDDKKHGEGKQTWPDGTVYEGEWETGEVAGFS